MTLHQIEAFAIVASMLGLFVSDRLRYDAVAALALSSAALTGNLTGDYLWSEDTGLGPDGFRPLRGMAATLSTAAAA